MLETPHVIVGAAIATKVANPALALPLAFGSHLILEKVPHWNPHIHTEKKKLGKISKQSNKIIAIDSTLALISGTYLASRVLPNYSHALVILLACLFAVLPDLIEAPYYYLNKNNKFIVDYWIPFKKKLQVNSGVFWGLLTQIIVIIAALYWI